MDSQYNTSDKSCKYTNSATARMRVSQAAYVFVAIAVCEQHGSAVALAL